MVGCGCFAVIVGATAILRAPSTDAVHVGGSALTDHRVRLRQELLLTVQVAKCQFLWTHSRSERVRAKRRTLMALFAIQGVVEARIRRIQASGFRATSL